MSFDAKPRSYKRVDIYDSETGTITKEALIDMQNSSSYLTADGLSNDTEEYPDGKVPFVGKHLLYLHRHPDTNPAHYLANLRAKLRLR